MKLADSDNLMSERILNAAIALFKARGYHGASMRELAQAVRIEAASLYYHFPSKQGILYKLFSRTMDACLAGLKQAIAGNPTPETQLRAAVRFHVLFHIARQDEAFISHSELRSLSAANRRRIIAKRDSYEKMLRGLLSAGVRAGSFDIADVRLTSTALLVMCSGVSDWFTGRGRGTANMVADCYWELGGRLVMFSGTPRARRVTAARPLKRANALKAPPRVAGAARP